MVPTTTSTPEPTQTPTQVIQQTVVPELASPPSIGTVDWVVSVFGCAIVAAIAFSLMKRVNLRWAARSALLALMGGFLAYLIIALQNAGEIEWLVKVGSWGVLLVVICGAGFGLSLTWLWQYLDQRGGIPKL
jgi:hypothetical protein